MVRRYATLLAAALIMGVAAHGVFQAIEHHGAGDAVAFCAASAAVVAIIFRVRSRGHRREIRPIAWTALPMPAPVAFGPRIGRTSAAWLQRFQN